MGEFLGRNCFFYRRGSNVRPQIFYINRFKDSSKYRIINNEFKELISKCCECSKNFEVSVVRTSE